MSSVRHSACACACMYVCTIACFHLNIQVATTPIRTHSNINSIASNVDSIETASITSSSSTRAKQQQHHNPDSDFYGARAGLRDNMQTNGNQFLILCCVRCALNDVQNSICVEINICIRNHYVVSVCVCVHLNVHVATTTITGHILRRINCVAV